MSGRPSRRRARGAALLVALMIVAMASLVASTMVLHQQRAIEIEAAERARSQAAWILNGALDWARLILREDARTVGADHLGEPWAVPLSEARLSTFLAADRNNTGDSDLDAFLSGAITDAQSRYNLRRTVGSDGKAVEAEVVALRRLCQAAGLAAEVADRIAAGLGRAASGSAPEDPLEPTRFSQLTWIGLDAPTLARLEPLVTLLPGPAPVNANTAPREVLLAAIDGIDLATAESIVRARQRNPLTAPDQLQALLPEGVKADPARVGIGSSFFHVQGRLRLDDRVLEGRWLIERRSGTAGGDVVVRQQERRTGADAGG